MRARANSHGNVFCDDDRHERQYRQLYATDKDFKAAVDWVRAAERQPPFDASKWAEPNSTTQALTAIAEEYAPAIPDDEAWAASMFETGTSFTGRLRAPITGVLMGHTHRPKHVSMDDGRVYLNTGAWASIDASGVTPAAIVRNEADGGSALLRWLREDGSLAPPDPPDPDGVGQEGPRD